MATTAFLHRVRLKNYRSIGACDVPLGPLNFLVGPNGSGKSNFIDALRFVSDSLNTSLDNAVRERGGINEVRRRSSGHPNNFALCLDFATPAIEGTYAFEITAAERGAWSVKREECTVSERASVFRHFRFAVDAGKVVSFPQELGAPPPANSDRLFLVNAAGHAPFRPLFDAFSRMGFYNLNPGAMRKLQPPDAGHLLKGDGSNIASALVRLASFPERMQRLVDYLGKITPGIVGVDPVTLGPAETVEFRQQVHGAKHPWRFLAQNMSDGTVRSLGVLLALQQTGNGVAIPLVGIEEPESAVHPAAAAVLLAAMREAATRTQVLATSHSADLLDDKDVSDAEILAVRSEQNETEIGPVDQASREALRKRLYTVGELLRMDQLQPDSKVSRPQQMKLFENDGR